MPSFSLFQNAPLALCMPRRPTFLLTSSWGMVTPASAEPSVWVLPSLRGSDRCWMMVLLTANLYLAPLGSDSEMRALRIELMMVLFQGSV